MAEAIAAEWLKLRTLPAALLTAAGTVLAGAALAAAFAAAAVTRGLTMTAAEPALAAVPFVQAGLLVLGALPFAQEYAGSQIRSTLTAVPRRGRVLLAKAVVSLFAASLTAVLTMAAALAASAITLGRLGAAVDASVPWQVWGAAGYLVLMGLLASGLALLLRQLMPTLVAGLALVMVVSPLLAAQSADARWLPDRAAQRLYATADGVLTPLTGGLVALAWIVLIGGAAAVRFVRRDA